MAIEHVIKALEFILSKDPAFQDRIIEALRSARDRDRSRLAQSIIREFLASGAKLTATQSRTLIAAMLHEDGQAERGAFPVAIPIRVSRAMSDELKESAARRGISVSDEIRRRIDNGKE